ncbi:hypothetical protein Taro_025654 [Colocasia esculenta]|uniref:Uncharacterized protein n=1 Tax=Colocasia esculenta TaxID=4460 RepID=A0A843VI75_COLES|nr:hypothetical protein [Colocasia esculenta]
MAENGEGRTIDNVTIALEKKQEEGRRASWSSALSSLFPANRRSQRGSRCQLRRRQPTAVAMAASEENSALFPIFILTIMALPLIPYTIVKLCRAASRKTRSIHCQCSAHKYFVEFISKAYQALTDPVSRENYENYGHPDGRQGLQMGIALPQFLLNIDGASGGLTQSNCQPYSKVLDVFIKASEYMEIPVRRSDDEPLQKLFLAVRSELNLDLKNIRTEQAKFWKQHPALIKVMELELKKLEDTVKSIHEEMFYLRSSNCQRLTKPLTYLLDSSRCHVYIYHRLWQPLK